MEPIEKTCHSRASGNPVLLTISAKAFNWRFLDKQILILFLFLEMIVNLTK